MRGAVFLAILPLASAFALGSLCHSEAGAASGTVTKDAFTLKARPSAAAKKPIDLYAVTLSPPELKVTRVRVRNRADYAVKSLILNWRIVRQQAPDTVLSSGKTAPLAVALEPGEARNIEFDVVSFREEYKRLGSPEGNFLIVVTASEHQTRSQGQSAA